MAEGVQTVTGAQIPLDLAYILDLAAKNQLTARGLDLQSRGLDIQDVQGQRNYALQVAQFNQLGLDSLRQYAIDVATLGVNVASLNFQKRLAGAQNALARGQLGVAAGQLGIADSAQGYAQRQGAANTKLQALGMLADRSGPQDWVGYNFLKDKLGAPTGQLVDPTAFANDLVDTRYRNPGGGGVVGNWRSLVPSASDPAFDMGPDITVPQLPAPTLAPAPPPVESFQPQTSRPNTWYVDNGSSTGYATPQEPWSGGPSPDDPEANFTGIRAADVRPGWSFLASGAGGPFSFSALDPRLTVLDPQGNKVSGTSGMGSPSTVYRVFAPDDWSMPAYRKGGPTRAPMLLTGDDEDGRSPNDEIIINPTGAPLHVMDHRQTNRFLDAMRAQVKGDNIILGRERGKRPFVERRATGTGQGADPWSIPYGDDQRTFEAGPAEIPYGADQAGGEIATTNTAPAPSRPLPVNPWSGFAGPSANTAAKPQPQVPAAPTAAAAGGPNASGGGYYAPSPAAGPIAPSPNNPGAVTTAPGQGATTSVAAAWQPGMRITSVDQLNAWASRAGRELLPQGNAQGAVDYGIQSAMDDLFKAGLLSEWTDPIRPWLTFRRAPGAATWQRVTRYPDGDWNYDRTGMSVADQRRMNETLANVPPPGLSPEEQALWQLGRQRGIQYKEDMRSRFEAVNRAKADIIRAGWIADARARIIAAMKMAKPTKDGQTYGDIGGGGVNPDYSGAWATGGEPLGIDLNEIYKYLPSTWPKLQPLVRPGGSVGPWTTQRYDPEMGTDWYGPLYASTMSKLFSPEFERAVIAQGPGFRDASQPYRAVVSPYSSRDTQAAPLVDFSRFTTAPAPTYVPTSERAAGAARTRGEIQAAMSRPPTPMKPGQPIQTLPAGAEWKPYGFERDARAGLLPFLQGTGYYAPHPLDSGTIVADGQGGWYLERDATSNIAHALRDAGYDPKSAGALLSAVMAMDAQLPASQRFGVGMGTTVLHDLGLYGNRLKALTGFDANKMPGSPSRAPLVGARDAMTEAEAWAELARGQGGATSGDTQTVPGPDGRSMFWGFGLKAFHKGTDSIPRYASGTQNATWTNVTNGTNTYRMPGLTPYIKYDPATLGSQPFYKKLTGERPSTEFSGWGPTKLTNEKLGITDAPTLLNLQSWRDMDVTDREMTEGLYQQGLGVDFRDILERSARGAPIGTSFGLARYGGL